MNMAPLQIGSCVSFAMTEEVQAGLIYAGTLLAVVFGCALIAWLMARRKRKRKKRQPRRWEEKPDPSHAHHSHTHRHKARTERPQNPTLAETGGLPPRKTDAASSSQSDTSESITRGNSA
jgi:ABC-type nickel/cobalt efflux system permease component RcnA